MRCGGKKRMVGKIEMGEHRKKRTDLKEEENKLNLQYWRPVGKPYEAM